MGLIYIYCLREVGLDALFSGLDGEGFSLFYWLDEEGLDKFY